MHINQQYIFNSIMINSFLSNDKEKIIGNKNRIKYHYTSSEAFLNILKSKSVYFTDIRYLNDKKEDIYLIELIKSYIEENEGRYLIVEKAFKAMLEDENSIVVINDKEIKYNKYRKFVFCTCKDSDSLVMWNYYVNNGNYQGYNIGFNIERFLKTFDTNEANVSDPFIVIYGPVLYTRKAQYKEIEEMLREIELLCESGDEGYAKAYLYMYIERYSPFFKHMKFTHENEYRVVVEINEKYLQKNGLSCCCGDNNKRIKYDFITKKGLVIPILKVYYNNDAISRVTISPMTEYEIAKESIKEMLRVNEYKSVDVYKSKVPIRF